jgi:lysozyme
MKYTQRNPYAFYQEYLDRQKSKTRCLIAGIGLTLAGVLAALGMSYSENKDSELRLRDQPAKIERILDDKTLDNIERAIGTGKAKTEQKNEKKPANEYRMSNDGINLVKQFEGLREDAYRCSAGVLTIGYGHTGDVQEGDRITREKATEYLTADLKHAENAVRKYVTVPLTQKQYDSLVSFAYNVGNRAFGKSTLLEKLNAGDYDGAAEQFQRWVKANGEKCDGLVNRRQKEKECFRGVES